MRWAARFAYPDAAAPRSTLLATSFIRARGRPNSGDAAALRDRRQTQLGPLLLDLCGVDADRATLRELRISWGSTFYQEGPCNVAAAPAFRGGLVDAPHLWALWHLI